MINFDKLWIKLEECNVSQYKLINKYNISPSTLTRLKRNESVSTNTIDLLCDILNCSVDEIMEHTKTP